MSKIDSIVLYLTSLSIFILITFVSYYLQLIDILFLKLDEPMYLAYAIFYYVFSNALLIIIYKRFLLDHGSFFLYILLGILDFILFASIFYFIARFDFFDANEDLFFFFLLFICNSFFICYSIYYKNLLKCKS